jgi:flagellar basal-body rod protein FlgF
MCRTLTQTANQLDLAITGAGYFTVQTKQGPRLTRAGHFTLQPDGTIGDIDGNALLNDQGQPVRMSPADTDITVAADGTISSQNGQLGKIGIVVPDDDNKMLTEGSHLLDASGGKTNTIAAKTPHVVQGMLEESNVQAVQETTVMMNQLREFQFVSQFVQAEADRQQSAIDKLTQRTA